MAKRSTQSGPTQQRQPKPAKTADKPSVANSDVEKNQTSVLAEGKDQSSGNQMPSADKSNDAAKAVETEKDPTENKQEETINHGARVSITAPHRRRRAGITFGPNATIIAVDDLSEADQLAIMNDKVLNVAPLIDDE